AADRAPRQDGLRRPARPLVPRGAAATRARPAARGRGARAPPPPPARAAAGRTHLRQRRSRPPALVPVHAGAVAADARRLAAAGARDRVSRRRAYILLAALCAVPRLGALLHERGDILTGFTEKSWRFA